MFSKLKSYPKKIFFFTFLPFLFSFFLCLPAHATDGSATGQQPSENTASPVDIKSAVGAAFDETNSTPPAVIAEKPSETAKAASVDEAEVTEYSAVMFVTGADTLNVRSGPSSENDKIGSFNLNQEVTVTGKTSNGWYQVDYNGSNGYVASKYLSEQSSVGATPTETPITEVATTETSTESEGTSVFQLSSITDLFTQFSATNVLVLLIIIVFISVLITTILLFRKKDADDEDDEDEEYEDDEDEYEEDDDEDEIPVKHFKQPIFSRENRAKKSNDTTRNYTSSASKKRTPDSTNRKSTSRQTEPSVTPKRNSNASPKATFQFYEFDSEQDDAQSLAEANAKIKKLQAEIDHLKKR